MIQLRNICKSYHSEILKEINYDFIAGNIYVMKGVSGSGKSTLLNIIGGIETDYTGEYFMDGVPMHQASVNQISKMRQSVGYIFQESLLISHLTIEENLLFFCKDMQQIKKYIEFFKIADLLHKFPSQLSNGQRQRISIIRSLLNNHKVILADEPTAALDPINAKLISQLFQLIKNENRIVIVATHDTCFDASADFIINLDYGSIKNDCQLVDIEHKKSLISQKNLHFLKEDLNYCWKNYKKNNRINIWLMTFIFTIILVCIGFQLHFASSYSNYIKNVYPYEVFNTTEALLEKINLKDKVHVFKNHAILLDDIEIYGLLPKEESSLNIPNALAEGSYPIQKNEVIINQDYKINNFTNYEKSVIGEKIWLPNFPEELIISGVLTNQTDILKDIYGSNANYRMSDKPQVFVDQSLLSDITTEIQNPNGVIVVSYSNLDENENDYIQLKERGLLYWENKINEKMYSINQFLMIFFSCLMVILFISYLFLYNTISLEIFLRRRELGFLELLGLDGKRIFKILFIEYFMKIIIPILIATIVYYSISYFVLSFYELRIYLSLIEYIIILSVLFLYVCLLVALPFIKEKKVNIITKIKS